MKRMFFLLMLLTVSLHASDGAQASSSAGLTVQKSLHGVKGVRIEACLTGCTCNLFGAPQDARFISWGLALKLKSSFNEVDARMCVKYFLKGYEQQEYEKARETQSIINNGKISKMLITIALEKSKVKLRVKGEADPETFQTFLPPYKVVIEGSDELSSESGSEGASQSESEENQNSDNDLGFLGVVLNEE